MLTTWGQQKLSGSCCILRVCLTAVVGDKYSMSNQQEGEGLSTAAQIEEINGDICTLQDKQLGGKQQRLI